MNAPGPVVAVLGAGSWGTALAIQLARNGARPVLWGRDASHLSEVESARENARYLPGVALPERLEVTSDLDAALRGADLVLAVTPSHAFATLCRRLAEIECFAGDIAWACKGFEPGTGRFLHQTAAEALGPDAALAVVTGPSFATEVARNLPTAVTVAGNRSGYTERVAHALHGGSFRAYTSDDLVGAELGGAVKNVLAIGTGICDGMALGDNARAALVTRGLAEMMRLGGALGARPETLMGLAGIGDLVLTCTGDLSRNRRLGLALGRGQSIDAAVAEIGQVVEGIKTAAEVRRLAVEHDVAMPISEQVFGILHEGWSPTEGVRRLLARAPKPEFD